MGRLMLDSFWRINQQIRWGFHQVALAVIPPVVYGAVLPVAGWDQYILYEEPAGLDRRDSSTHAHRAHHFEIGVPLEDLPDAVLE